MNLLTSPEDLSTWGRFACTATDLADGSHAPWRIESTGANSFSRTFLKVQEGFQSEDVVLSMFVRAGTSPNCALNILSDASNAVCRQNFDQSAGVFAAGATVNATNLSIAEKGVVDRGGGFYRVWIRVTVGATSEPSLTVRLQPAWSQAGVLHTFAGKAMLERSSTLSPYPGDAAGTTWDGGATSWDAGATSWDSGPLALDVNLFMGGA